jgi:hypothetical protein
LNLRVLSYNIRFGGAGREDLIARIIAFCEPEVVVRQEATSPKVVQRLASALDMPAW